MTSTYRAKHHCFGVAEGHWQNLYCKKLLKLLDRIDFEDNAKRDQMEMWALECKCDWRYPPKQLYLQRQIGDRELVYRIVDGNGKQIEKYFDIEIDKWVHGDNKK